MDCGREAAVHWGLAQAPHQRAVLVPQLLRGVLAEGVEVLGHERRLLAPHVLVDGEQEVEVGLGEVGPLVSRAPLAGRMPMGVSTPSARPSRRSTIHFRTRLFSPKPGHTNLPASFLRNQFT